MSSTIYFRMFHAKQFEPINFDGHQIRLIDIKRSILEKKMVKSGGIDFDLQITDADNSNRGFLIFVIEYFIFFSFKIILNIIMEINCLVYDGDDTFVPKNTNLIAKRVPLSGAGPSLMSRLYGSIKSQNK